MSQLKEQNANQYRRDWAEFAEIEQGYDGEAPRLEDIADEIQNRLEPLLELSESIARSARTGRAVDDQMSRHAKQMLSEVHLLSVLAQGLRSAPAQYEWETVEIARLVEDARRVFETEARNLGLEFHVEVQIAQFELSKRHMSLALINLFDNAVKYSYRGSGDRIRTIRTRGRREGDFYVLEIENYGVGILPENATGRFRKGYGENSEPTARPIGRGLGLSVASGVIDRHGGGIEFQSRRAGSAYVNCITVKLPIVRHSGGDSLARTDSQE